MAEHITYGPDGFDPEAGDGNVVDRFEIEVPEAVAEETPLAERVEALEAVLSPE